MATDYDVIIIGAGISGVNSAYWLQKELPESTYTILEQRDSMGGTWDLFRYPGIRSDSDLHTFGFSWRPWSKANAIADGPSIKSYMKDSAQQYGIDTKIRYRHSLKTADWSSAQKQWTITVDADGTPKTYTTRFLWMGTGYYDYHTPLKTEIPGIDSFQGKKIHPQFWPEDYDYTGKKIVIIGSGATAITLLPNLVEKAAHVTILQRSPSYIMSLPNNHESWIHKYLPSFFSQKIARMQFILMPWFLFNFVRRFPNFGRNMMRKLTIPQLPKSIPHDPHFKPRYKPWDQRLCLCPDGDFFKALHTGKADMVTSAIKTVTATGIETETGLTLDADVIITATGLKMQVGGGTTFSIDGQAFKTPEKFMYRTAMLQDLPNASFVIGYDNASWTLGADTTAILVTRILKYMKANHYTQVTPTLDRPESLNISPMLHLNSTYVEKAKGLIPKTGDSGPWMGRTSYMQDLWKAKYADIKHNGLAYS